jgi:hypothetical protein
VLFGSFFAPAAVLVAFAGSQALPPPLEVSPKVVDAGVVFHGSMKEATFSLTNTGAVPIAVAQVETSCTCLKVELPRIPIAPGETATAGILIDLRGASVYPGRFTLEASGFAERRTGAVFTIRVDVTILN